VTLTTFTAPASGCAAHVVAVLADGGFVVAGGAGSDVQFPIAPAVPAAKGGLFAAEFSADGAPRRTLVFPSARAFVDRVIPLPTGGYWVVGDHSGPIDLDPGAAVAERELAPDAQTQLFGSRVDSSGAFVAGWSLEGSYLTLQDAVVDRAGALVVSGRATSSPEHLQPWVDLDPGPATMKQAGESFYVVNLDGSTLLGSRAWAGRVYGWLVALPDGDLLVPGAFRGVASFGEPGGAARSANEHAAFFMRLTPALAVRSLTTFGDSETEVLLPRASSSGFVVTGHAIREADGVPAPREKAHGSWSFVSTYAF
jgi:hypothetical protein